MKIQANGITITIRKTKTASGNDGLNILLSSPKGQNDSLCHIIPDDPDSRIVIFNSATAKKHKVGFDVIDTGW